jgi:ABC-type multidrug transport system fused ATPase/permease subunit
LFTPQSGTVKVNGVNLQDCIDSWSHILAYVQQSIFLTDDTLRNNIAFGLKPEEIDDSRVWRAIEQAQLGDFVKTLDGGLDTIVGERGVKFSGGQRQRVAIARALYFETQVIIFDEATSALDNESEFLVAESLNRLAEGRTTLTVAHRLSTIRNADRIMVLTEEGIAESGTHTELMEKGGIYCNLYNMANRLN